MRNERQLPRRVLHSALPKISDESDFRVRCPACKDGILLVQRLSCGWLPWTDRCVSCGQMVVYEDERIGHERIHRPIMLVLRWPHEEEPCHIHGSIYAVAFIGEERHSAAALVVQMPEETMRCDTEHVCVAEPLSRLPSDCDTNDGLALHYGAFMIPGRIGSVHPWGVPFRSMPPWPGYQRIGSGPPVRAEEH